MQNKDIDIVMKRLETHFQSVKTPVVDLIQIKTEDPFIELKLNI